VKKESCLKAGEDVNILINQKEDVQIVKLVGYFETDSQAELENKISGLIESGTRKIAFDLAELERISSTGLRIFLSMAKKMKKSGGKLVLFSLRSHVREIFEISGLTAALPVFASEEEALREGLK
jgi:stage II sporulation protein AA (anti-sigma F factor antagonist)